MQWNRTENICQIGQNKAPTIIPRGLYCYIGLSMRYAHTFPSWCEMVRLSVVEFSGNKVSGLRASAICTVGLLIGLCASFNTSDNLTVRWPAIACLLGRFADLLVLEWLYEKYVVFRHLVRFCRSYIRSVIMFHMAKHSGIQSIFFDFRHATTSPHRHWVFIVVSHSLCKDWLHACHKVLLSS